MNNIFREKKWSPYVAGSLVGVLLCLSVLITEKYIGASTTFVRTAGMIERLVAPDHVNNNEYYASKKIKVDWQWMFVFGILFGSLITSKISGDFKLTYIPAMWNGRFGNSTTKRWIAAFCGGVIAMFGARLAGG